MESSAACCMSLFFELLASFIFVSCATPFLSDIFLIYFYNLRFITMPNAPIPKRVANTIDQVVMTIAV